MTDLAGDAARSLLREQGDLHALFQQEGHDPEHTASLATKLDAALRHLLAAATQTYGPSIGSLDPAELTD